MAKKARSEEQILRALHQAESGERVADICREHGVSEATAAAAELRELVRLRTRLMQEVIDRINQLHRLIDLGFPEFTRYLSDVEHRAC